MFTYGNARQYKSLMREPPGNSPRHSGGQAYGFCYKYEDLSCDYCLYRKKCGNDICPSIMDCLEDLKYDPAFLVAVDNAELCGNNHRKALLYLKENDYHQ